jgi:MFS family permease
LFSIFTVLSALFILSMFFRVSTGVIAPELAHDLKLTAASLGFLGGVFFYSFAFMQIPMGPLLDIIGPRTVVTLFVLIGAVGSFLFAASNSFFVACSARILMGIGMASVLMGSFKVFTLRFPNGRFATLAGLIVTVGTLGNVAGASPLAWLSAAVGWRQAFVWAGAVTVALALTCWFTLKNDEGERSARAVATERIGSFWPSLRLVLGTLSFWQISSAAFFRYGTFVSLQGLWLGLYFMDVQGLTPVKAGNLLALLAIGNSIGSLIAGRIADLHPGSTKRVALVGLTLYTLSLIPLVRIIPLHGVLPYALICFLLGFFHSFGTLLYAHSKELFPIEMAGTAMAWVNFFIMAGGAVLMQFIGLFIGSFPHSGHSYPPYAYHLAFLFCFLSMASGLVFYAFSKPANGR